MKEEKQEDIMNVLEKAQQDMAIIKQTMIQNINEKIMPFKAQKALRQNDIRIGDIIKECVLSWASIREKIIPNGISTGTDMVRWNEALVEIIDLKVNEMMDKHPDKVFILCEILAGKKLNEESPEDGILMGELINNFAGYIAEACKKRFIELQEVTVGKSLMGLSETASALNTLIMTTNGLKNQQ